MPTMCKQSCCSLSNTGCYGSGVYSAEAPSYASVANTSRHKSFDLSDVAIDGVGSNGYFRQFHQTRIFVRDFKGMLSHGQELGEGTCLLTANLPDQVQYSFGSQWSAPLGNYGSSTWNGIIQLMGGVVAGAFGGDPNNFKSGINRVTSVKIWGKSDPFSITLNIPVLDDSYYCGCRDRYAITNFSECLEFLGALSLPSESTDYGFYIPPPSPLNAQVKIAGKTFDLNSIIGRITVIVGGMLMLDNCVLEKVSVTYPNTKALIKKQVSGGNSKLVPLLANVSMTFSSIEALTSKTYSKILWLQAQNDIGKFGTDFDSAAKSLVDGVKAGVNASINYLTRGTKKPLELSNNGGTSDVIQMATGGTFV